jgi:U3 small nucleolar RNA-associated protein 12
LQILNLNNNNDNNTIVTNLFFFLFSYSDGVIRLWDLRERKCSMTYNGHKSGVTALCFNQSGSLLASGSADTHLILWDMISESGLFRLRGHKDAITDCKFLEMSLGSEKSNDIGVGGRLISSSKDGHAKIWDLVTEHCVQTIVDGQGEVWSLDIDPKETRLVLATSEPVLRIYDLTGDANIQDATAIPLGIQNEEEKEEDSSASSSQRAKLFGTIPRHSTKDRAVMVRFHKDGTLLACQSASKQIDVYKVLAPGSKEVSKKVAKRKRRLTKKQKGNNESSDSSSSSSVLPTDEFSFIHTLRASQKVRSFAFSPVSNQLLVSLFTNMTELYELSETTTKDEDGDGESSEEEKEEEEGNKKRKKGNKKKAEKKVITVSKMVGSIEQGGHRSDVRALAISSDDTLIASTSSDMVKVWNLSTKSCLRSMDSGYGLCVAFVPGNRHIVVGTKGKQTPPHSPSPSQPFFFFFTFTLPSSVLL